MAPHNNEMRCYGDETRLIGQFCSGYWDRTLVLYNLRNGHGKFGFNVQHKKGTVAYAKLYCEDRNDDDENEGESENQGQVRNHGKDQNQSADMSLAKFAKYLNMSQEHVIEDAMNGLFTGPGPSDGYRWSDDVSVEDAKASASNPLLIIFTPRRSYRESMTDVKPSRPVTSEKKTQTETARREPPKFELAPRQGVVSEDDPESVNRVRNAVETIKRLTQEGLTKQAIWLQSEEVRSVLEWKPSM